MSIKGLAVQVAVVVVALAVYQKFVSKYVA